MIRGGHGAVGLGQVDADESHRLPRQPHRRGYWLNGHRVSELGVDELARIRNKEIGFVFQTFNLLPRATSLQNVELPLVYAGIGAKERRDSRPRRSPGSAWRPDGSPPQRAVRRPAPTGGDRPGPGQPPRLLLADEPTGNLDSATSEEIMELFEALHRRPDYRHGHPRARHRGACAPAGTSQGRQSGAGLRDRWTAPEAKGRAPSPRSG